MSPSIDGPLRIETVNGELHVLGQGMSCACATREEAEALLADLRTRLGHPLMDRVRAALRALAADGWITTAEPDHTGTVCRAFDANPDAPGYACVLHPIPDDHVIVEVGEGIGDENADMVAAESVILALEGAGLRAGIGLHEGAACVVAQAPKGGGA